MKLIRFLYIYTFAFYCFTSWHFKNLSLYYASLFQSFTLPFLQPLQYIYTVFLAEFTIVKKEAALIYGDW